MARRSTSSDAFADLYEEGTEEYDSLHVNLEALCEISEILKRVRWYNKACPSLEISLVYDPSQVISDKRALERTTDVRNVLKTAADAVHKIWEGISYQVEACEHDIQAYKDRQGFFILPDEILSNVLEYAALRGACDNREKASLSTIKEATKLSHVCKRFRALLTHSSSLWQYVFGGMKNLNMVSTCLSRCRRANAEISLTISSSGTRVFLQAVNRHENTSFIRAAMERSNVWNSFTMDGHSADFDSLGNLNDGQLGETSELTKGLDLPNLSTLSIHYPQIILNTKLSGDQKLRDILHYYSTWCTPKLRSMTTSNFVPVPFSGTSSVTLLTISLHFDRYGDEDDVSTFDVQSMVTFLAACPLLTGFALKIHDAKHAVIPALPVQRVELPCMKNLDLEFSECKATALKPLFTAVRFPCVTTMRLKISSIEDDPYADMHFSDIFYVVLPNADAFPKLADMKLDVHADGSYYITPGGNSIRMRDDISIPFHTMPHIRSFELATCSTVQPITECMTLPALRTLVIRDCHKLEKDWLARVLKHSVDQGNLDLLRVSVLGPCKAMEALGRKGALSKEDIVRLIA